MRDISTLCLKQAALCSKAMPNSIDFYKGIFFHAIPGYSTSKASFKVTFPTIETLQQCVTSAQKLTTTTYLWFHYC